MIFKNGAILGGFRVKIACFGGSTKPLGGFRYIHLTKGTFILNFDSTLPLFNSKNNSKLKIFEQKFQRFLRLKI